MLPPVFRDTYSAQNVGVLVELGPYNLGVGVSVVENLLLRQYLIGAELYRISQVIAAVWPFLAAPA